MSTAELRGRASPLECGAQALPQNINPATASLYIVNPLRQQGMTTLVSTHPPIAERLRRLRALDADRTLRRAE